MSSSCPAPQPDDAEDLYLTDPVEIKKLADIVRRQNERMKDPVFHEATYKAYTGVGSRSTPEQFLYAMYMIGFILGCRHWTLRSGAAPGADSAFEEKAYCTEIFVPWDGFQGRAMYADIPEEAFHIASQRYKDEKTKDGKPLWSNMRESVQALQARNIQQVLGVNLDRPSKFLLCWTPDGAEHHSEVTMATGGTGTAIWCASKNGIEVINMERINWCERLSEITGYDFSHLKV